jgi:hypothetical protein
MNASSCVLVCCAFTPDVLAVVMPVLLSYTNVPVPCGGAQGTGWQTPPTAVASAISQEAPVKPAAQLQTQPATLE